MSKNKILLLFLSVLIFQACSPPGSKDEVINLRKQFEEGMILFEKGKYYRAQEEFDFVLRRGTYSEFADSAQFYLAESYFLNKEYKSELFVINSPPPNVSSVLTDDEL